MFMKKFEFRPYLLSVAVSTVLISCTGSKNSVYFKNTNSLDSVISSMPMDRSFITIVRPDDILSINITSISSINETSDPVSIYREGGTIFSTTAAIGNGNATGGGGGSSQGSSPRAGFLVDKEGLIDFPVLGKLAVSGLSIRAVKELLIQRLKVHIKDPVVEGTDN